MALYYAPVSVFLGQPVFSIRHRGEVTLQRLLSLSTPVVIVMQLSVFPGQS